MAKRSHEDAFFVFDMANCIGEDVPVVEPYEPYEPYVPAAPVASHEASAPTGAHESEDVDDLIVEDLGVTYSPADDERPECRTPDPMFFVDADALAVIDMLGGGSVDNGSLLCMEPLTAQPAAPPPTLNRSGDRGCFATHPVCDPPRLGLSTPTAAEYAAMLAVPEPKEAKRTSFELFQTVEGNRAGVLSEFGGVRAWMSRSNKTLVN